MTSPLASAIFALSYLCVSVAVFVLGSSYYGLFRTNKGWVYRTALACAGILAVWLTSRFTGNEAIKLLSIGFLAAALANLSGWAMAWLHGPLRLSSNSMKGLALQKLLEAVGVVGSILLVYAITGTPLTNLYLVKGNLNLGLLIGLGGFSLFVLFAALQARSLKLSPSQVLHLLPWVVTFALSNAFMEELWFRGVFLRPLIAFLGVLVASLLSAAIFALAHVGASYMSRGDRARFLLFLFPLGVGWALCFHYTGSIIASTLFHAGADLMIINVFLSSFREADNKG